MKRSFQSGKQLQSKILRFFADSDDFRWILSEITEIQFAGKSEGSLKLTKMSLLVAVTAESRAKLRDSQTLAGESPTLAGGSLPVFKHSRANP